MSKKKDTRLSQAFPPGFKGNNKYYAKVHTYLKELGQEIDVDKIEFKEIEYQWEVDELQKLHKEWFPVPYPDAFFQALYEKRYDTILAVYRVKLPGERLEKTLILGSISYELQPISNKILKFSMKQLCREYQAIYIQTFGVINEVRNKGIASKLLSQVLQEADEDSDIKYVYLDVIPYNEAAIRFYVKQNFSYAFRREGFYELFGQTYDSHVYVLFRNGGKRAWRGESCRKLVEKIAHVVNIPSHCADLCVYLSTKLKKNKKKKTDFIEV